MIEPNMLHIIHHGGCFDGVVGAWVVSRYLRERFPRVPQILIPAHYGGDPPDVKGAFVYIVDFSYPRAVLEEMNMRAENLFVMDHHKTAEEDLKGLSYCLFDMERSGAGIAWDFLFSHNNRPWIVTHVEDRDLWRFKIPGTKEIIAYLASRPLTVEQIEETSKMAEETVIQRGVSILEYIDTYGDKVCETWTMRRIGGWTVPVINTPYMNSSDHVEKLSEKLPGHPFYAYFFMKNGVWQFGLRSKGDFDVSEVAQMFGGGGHKNASGFTVDILPWEQR